MKKALLLLIIAILFLNSCQSAIPIVDDAIEIQEAIILPEPIQPYEAPKGDAQMEYSGVAALYLPRRDGTRLVVKYSQVLFSASRHEAETAVRALLTYPETDDCLPAGKGVTIQLTGNTPVEISHDVCSVNLTPSCLALDMEDFITLCQAITNTVTEFLDVKYVNILVSGRQIGLDTASMLPLGTLQRRVGEDLGAAYSRVDIQRVKYNEEHEQKRFTSAATLYFPAADGNGILPEARMITFPGQMPAQLAQTLLNELSQGAQLLSSIPALPNLNAFLTSPPAVTQTSTGTRHITLSFDSSLNEALAESQLTRSSLMASLTYTLTTFIPETSGVIVFIGDEPVLSVTPASIYAANEPIYFRDGVQQRGDYSRLLLGLAKLYFASEDGQKLIAVYRPVPYFEVRNPRYLLEQLAQGPKPYDDYANVRPVMPEGLRDPDFLGFAVEDDTLLINLSLAFQAACSQYDETRERLLIYAMVNTLCETLSLKRVRFYIADNQPEYLSGHLYLPGYFIINTGIIRTR